MNPKCRRDSEDRSLIYAGCNANSNGQNEAFRGNLFDLHECPFCQKSRYSLLLHVCDALRIDKDKDRMCIDCVVQSMCTSKHGKSQTYCPTRHHTPLVTAMVGISLLDEAKKIIMLAYKTDDSISPFSEWKFLFEFEKKINKTNERTDLVVTIYQNDVIRWYILGTITLLFHKLLLVCILIYADIFVFQSTVENEMTKKGKNLDVQFKERWIHHFEKNLLDTNNDILWMGVTFNNPRKEPLASKLLCHLSPQLKMDFILDHTQIIDAVHSNELKNIVYTYGIEAMSTLENVIKCLTWDRKSVHPAETIIKNIRTLSDIKYTSEGGLAWIRNRVDFLNNVNHVPHMDLWRLQCGVCVYCDCLLHPPSGQGLSILSPYYMHKNQNSSEKIHFRYSRNNFNAGLCKCVPSILKNTQQHNLVCCECYDIHQKLDISKHEISLEDLESTTREVEIDSEESLFFRIAFESKLTCVQSVYIIGEDEVYHPGEILYRMRLNAFVTNVTHSTIVAITLPFRYNKKTHDMMMKISKGGLFKQDISFSVMPNIDENAQIEYWGNKMSGFILQLINMHTPISIHDCLTDMKQHFRDEQIESKFPDQYFVINLPEFLIMVIVDMKSADIPMWEQFTTVARVEKTIGPLFFSINNNRKIYRLVCVFNMTQKKICYVTNLPYDGNDMKWTDGNTRSWNFYKVDGQDISGNHTGTQARTLHEIITPKSDNDIFLNMYLCVQSTENHNRNDKQDTVTKCQEHRMQSIQLRVKTLNQEITHDESVRVWCILLKLIGSILFHNFCLKYNVDIHQNIFMFVYWTGFVIYCGFDGDENESLLEDTILKYTHTQWTHNQFNYDEMSTLFTQYLQTLSRNNSIHEVFAQLVPAFKDSPQTLSRNVRDLCLFEYARGVVDSSGYSPLRNLLLMHYLAKVLGFKGFCNYLYMLQNVSSSELREKHINKQIDDLGALEDCESMDPLLNRLKPKTRNRNPVSMTRDQPNSRQRPRNTNPNANKKKPIKAPSAALKMLQKPQQFGNDKRQFFSIGMEVLVHINVSLKMYSKKGTNLLSNILGPFEIKKFIQKRIGKKNNRNSRTIKVELIIPPELRIKGIFNINDLRKFKESPISRTVTEKDIRHSTLAREILAERIGEPRQFLIWYYGYTNITSSWEPPENTNKKMIKWFHDRQEYDNDDEDEENVDNVQNEEYIDEENEEDEEDQDEESDEESDEENEEDLESRENEEDQQDQQDDA